MKAKMQVEEVEPGSPTQMVRPVTNWQPIILAVIAIVPTLAATFAGWQASVASSAAQLAVAQSAKTATAVDGRMTELLELTRRSSKAEGALTEKAAQNVREGDAAIEAAKPQAKK